MGGQIDVDFLAENYVDFPAENFVDFLAENLSDLSLDVHWIVDMFLIRRISG